MKIFQSTLSDQVINSTIHGAE